MAHRIALPPWGGRVSSHAFPSASEDEVGGLEARYAPERSAGVKTVEK
jgi:hypothetical protein